MFRIFFWLIFFIFNSEIIKSTNFQRRVRAFGDIVPVQFVAQRVFADSAMAYLLSDKPSCVLTSFFWSYMILGIEGKETFSIQSVHLICVFFRFCGLQRTALQSPQWNFFLSPCLTLCFSRYSFVLKDLSQISHE